MSNRYIFHDETFVCESCGRTVTEQYSTCGDIHCPLFTPRYEVGDEDIEELDFNDEQMRGESELS